MLKLRRISCVGLRRGVLWLALTLEPLELCALERIGEDGSLKIAKGLSALLPSMVLNALNFGFSFADW